MEQASSTIPVDAIRDSILGILSGGTTDNIIKGVLLLLVGIGAIFVLRWLKKKEIEAAQRRNNERRDSNQTTTDNEAQTVSDDANQSEDRIEDLLE